MNPVVAVIAAGAMGSAVGRRLTENNLRVLTVLEGRSTDTKRRAAQSGMIAVTFPELAKADFILSIVPPGEALALARSVAVSLAAISPKPIYVDCNAINPKTAARVAEILHPAGIDYVDAGIIGGPPAEGYGGPMIYLSGKRASEVTVLSNHGLVCPVLASGPFAASALKMSYAGITKGLTALGSIMLLGAARAGVADALRSELAASQPMLLAWFARQIPSMFPKAGRWVAEMEEIASFLRQSPEGADLFGATAGFYKGVARQPCGTDAESLVAFFRSVPAAGTPVQPSATPTRSR